MDPDDPAYQGQAGYAPFLFAIYYPFVLGFMARAVWRCPTPPVVERYRRHLRRRHLDVGPGTGYFIEHAAPPAGTEITLARPEPERARPILPQAGAYAPDHGPGQRDEAAAGR